MHPILAADPTDSRWFYIGLGCFTVVALLGAGAAGIFRRESVAGPPRLALGESAGTLSIILGIAIFVWLAGPMLYLQLRHPPSVPSAAASQPAPSSSTTAPASAPATPASPLLSPGEIAGLTAGSSILVFVVALALNVMSRPRAIALLGLSPRNIAPGVLKGLIGLLIALIPLLWAMILTQKLWELLGLEHPAEHQLLQILGNTDNPWIAYLVILSAAIVAPFSEELIFRGHLQTLLARLFAGPEDDKVTSPPLWQGDKVTESTTLSPPHLVTPSPCHLVIPTAPILPYAAATAPWPAAPIRWLAIILTSLLFAAIHPWWTMPPIFFLSLCLGYAYERTGNLFVPITIHALFNISSLTLFLLASGQGGHGGG